MARSVPEWRKTIIPGVKFHIDNKCVESVVNGIPIPRLRFNRIVPYMGGQTLALCNDAFDVFLGGEGGTGKSRVLLLAALQFCDVPGYAGLLLRRTYQDLVLPGAALSVAHELLDGIAGVTWHGKTHSFVFDTGSDHPASLTFGHLSSGNAHERYRGAEIQFVGIDEITHIPEAQALFLFTRLRRPKDVGNLAASKDGVTLGQIPLRYRGAANPGGRYVDWVKSRYVDPDTRYPGSWHHKLVKADNPSLDAEEYAKSLSHLPEAEMRRMLYGDWNITNSGKFFDRTMFKPAVDYPKGGRMVRYWDLAATEDLGGNDPDWSVGLLGTLVEEIVDGKTVPVIYLIDVARHRWGPAQVEPGIEGYALSDPPGTECHWEQEGGSHSKILSNIRAAALRGKVRTKAWIMSGQGPKPTRARLVVPMAEAGNIRIVVGAAGQAAFATPKWRPFLDEIHAFDGTDKRGQHDDCVDALSGLWRALTIDTRMRVATRQSDREAAYAERDRRAREAADAAARAETSTATDDASSSEVAAEPADDIAALPRPDDPALAQGPKDRRRIPQF